MSPERKFLLDDLPPLWGIRAELPLRNATVTKEGRGSLTKVFQVQLQW